MAQPNWNLLDNLGDDNAIDHGGYFVYEDETGVYAPEGELLEAPPECDESWDAETGDYSATARWIVYRFCLDRCTYINGVLSDNKFHPDHPAWFADNLRQLAEFVGLEERELLRMFCSDDALDRAHAWRAVGDYFGYANLDDGPLELTHEEVKARYPDFV